MRYVKNKPTLYGLTGGIASGKSTAANFFINKGVKVFDSDLAVKEIWNTDLSLIKLVNDKYNINIQTKEGKKTLANIIFNNEEEKEFVNSLIHPKVFNRIDEFILVNSNEKYLIIDMPLLFEVGYENNLDEVILIHVDIDTQIKRLVKRDNISKEEAIKLINNQMPLKNKVSLSKFVVDNNKTLENTKKQLEDIYGVISNEDE